LKTKAGTGGIRNAVEKRAEWEESEIGCGRHAVEEVFEIQSGIWIVKNQDWQESGLAILLSEKPF